jgi:hypothetical protein
MNPKSALRQVKLRKKDISESMDRLNGKSIQSVHPGITHHPDSMVN